MITVRITFLLPYSLDPKAGKDDNAKSNKDERKKTKLDSRTKKSQSDASSKMDRKSKKTEFGKDSAVVLSYEYLVGNPIGFSHIEYQLFPGRPKYQVDVLCWGPIAKVFSADGDVLMKTFVTERSAWVCACLVHNVNDLNTQDLLRFYQHTIECTIWTGREKLTSRAKAEKGTRYYILEKHVNGPERFVPAYETDPNQQSEEDDQQSLKNHMKNIIFEAVNKPGCKYFEEIVSCAVSINQDPLHYCQVNNIINKVLSGNNENYRKFAPVCHPPSAQPEPLLNQSFSKHVRKKKNMKENKKSEKTRKQRTTDFQIRIPAEVLFTDPHLSIYDSSLQTQTAFVLLSSSGVMSTDQSFQLNPLIVRIKKLHNLPVEILRTNGFTSVFASYDVQYIAKCKTVEKEIASEVKIYESHAHFVNGVPKLRLHEFLNCERFRIWICGVRTVPPKPADIFGKRPNDENISIPLTKKASIPKVLNRNNSTIVTLAIVTFDLSSITKPLWWTSENASCYDDPHSHTLKKPTYETHHLLDLGTSLEADIFMLVPQIDLIEILSSATLYQRMFLTSTDREVVNALKNEVMLHNLKINWSDIQLPIDSLSKVMKARQDDISILSVSTKGTHSLGSGASFENSNHFISGFILDDAGRCYSVYLEGPTNIFAKTIWRQIMNSPKSALAIHYNSDLYFETRLYEEFCQYSGVLQLVLKIPLEKIWKNPRSYFNKVTESLSKQAITKLLLLHKCITFRSMMQHNLFPASNELISLSEEWGRLSETVEDRHDYKKLSEDQSSSQITVLSATTLFQEKWLLRKNKYFTTL